MDVMIKYRFVLFFLIFSCCSKKTEKKVEIKNINYNNHSQKKQIILKENDSLEFYDLSGKNLKQIPDLSKFYITNLNLSNNSIKKLNYNFLPKNLLYLNLSFNKLDTFKYKKNLNKLDLSFNQINYIQLENNIDSINLSHNNLAKIFWLSHGKVSFLDISNNEKLSNILDINLKYFKKIKYDSIANNKKLISLWKSKRGGIIK